MFSLKYKLLLQHGGIMFVVAKYIGHSKAGRAAEMQRLAECFYAGTI
jgi:hypothetical protein